MRNLFREYSNEVSVNNLDRGRDLFEQQQQHQLSPLNQMYLNKFEIKNIENRIYDNYLGENLQEKLQKKLFFEALDSDHDEEKSTIYFEFNTDTKLKAFGGLSMWQFTAVCIFVLILIGNLYYSLLAECTKKFLKTSLIIAVLVCIVKKIMYIYSERKNLRLKRIQFASRENSYFGDSFDKLITQKKCVDSTLDI